jgi:hypothetical protein
VKKFFAEIIKPESPFRLALTFFIPFVVILSMLFALLILWEKKSHDRKLANTLKESAMALFDQIMITRLWNAQHGGVYVEVTSETPPNPYLEDPRRDIVSVDGRRYTKVNPAYMTRQLSEITMQRHGYKFRIISLNPVNPYNIPDEWERNALRKFENGNVEEYADIFEQDGGRVFKYIAPLKVEESCLKCHAKHGYSYGDIRGGISIIIPMERYDLLYSIDFRKTIISLLAIAAVSIIFVAGITLIVSKRLSSAIERDMEREKLAAIIELAGATAHEMRQPMTIVHNLIGLFKEKFKNQEPLTEEEMNIINNQCDRMNNIIKKMLNITDYKTKDYIRGKKIIDLDRSSKTGDKE